MYHPTRGGVRGGRDQFTWEDVKVDKHRENYLGHSIKAPVGRWQKGKDLYWYTRDKKSQDAEMEAAKEEIKRIKEEEEQAMREALGLAPKRANRPQGNRLDKHEFSELVKRGSTAEDLGAGHAEAARVQGLGFAKAPRPWEEPGSSKLSGTPAEVETLPVPSNLPATKTDEDSEDESRRKRRREERKEEKREKREERKEEKREKREKRHSREDRKHEKREKHEKRHSRDSDDRKRHKKDKERRRHDSDSD